MLRSIGGKTPRVDRKAHVFDSAAVIGNVVLGEYSSVWYNATLRGDKLITVGKYTNIQDNACLHGESSECHIGDYVTVGHGAIIHCCTVEDHCLIGMGAIILDEAVIGSGSIIGAGTLVPKGMKIPPASLVLGSPAKVVKTLAETAKEKIHRQAVRYKTLWTKDYGLFPDADGETYEGDKII